MKLLLTLWKMDALQLCFVRLKETRISFDCMEKGLPCCPIPMHGMSIHHISKFTRAQDKSSLRISSWFKLRAASAFPCMIMQVKGTNILNGRREKEKKD